MPVWTYDRCILGQHDAMRFRVVRELSEVLHTVPDRFSPWIQTPLLNSSSLFEFVMHATECAQVQRGRRVATVPPPPVANSSALVPV